jgi:hypothetical protein
MKDNGEWREVYGKWWPLETDPGSIELWGVRTGGQLGKYGHMHNAIDRIWNDYQADTFIWNDWSELMLSTFCENKWTTVTGPGASWKTTCASMFVLVSWYSSPRDTIVVCTSSTLPGLRRRIWKEISRFYRLRPAFGNPVQSQYCIQFEKGLDDAGIFGLSTDKGEIEKAIGKIIGFHAPNVIVVVDEMPYTPEAIVEACVNLESGARSFQFIGIGNADDMLDPHGRMSEPKRGWDTISEETEQWETRRGICIHLDGLKSPNVIAKRNLYPGLLNQSDIDTTAELYGIDSPRFWQQRRGFWAPEGVQKTVLTMPMIVRARAKEQPVFDVDFIPGASLDPAFEGGDRCVLRFGKCGKSDGKMIMALGEKIFIKTVQSEDDPRHYQIVRQTRDECIKRGVSPFMFALDSTGEGGGLASMFQREWHPQILQVEFGGRPPKEPVSQTNPKRSDQEYDRMVTFLWFFFRLLVQNEQIKGLDDETATEFCRRWYKMQGPYISIETKDVMKERTRFSPDLADNAVIMARLFSKRAGLSLTKVAGSDFDYVTPWKKFQKARSLESAYEQSVSY